MPLWVTILLLAVVACLWHGPRLLRKNGAQPAWLNALVGKGAVFTVALIGLAALVLAGLAIFALVYAFTFA